MANEIEPPRVHTKCGMVARIYSWSIRNAMGWIHGAVWVPLGVGMDGWNLAEWNEEGHCVTRYEWVQTGPRLERKEPRYEGWDIDLAPLRAAGFPKPKEGD